MFTTDPFYFSLTRKYVSLFGTLFNSIKITRELDGTETAIIKVPITYAPKEKMMARVQQDPNVDRLSATLPLPMMSFEMMGLGYDAERHLNTMGRKGSQSSAGARSYQYNPVPYNIAFRLYVYAKFVEDGTKIIEQILPYFTPAFTVTVNMIPELDEKKDIPIVLNSITQEDTYENGWQNRQLIMWTLEFTLQGYFYGPISTAPVIKFANTVFYAPHVNDGELSTAVGNTMPSAWVQVRPGLLANGSPTSNASLTVSASEIEASDDYGYVIEITEQDIE